MSNPFLRGGGTQRWLASAARTVSGAEVVPFDFSGLDKLRIQLHVTAFGGSSPTLDVVVEDTLDGTNWNNVATFARLIGTGREVLNVTGLFSNRLRVRWTISGTTPTFTFSMDGYAE